jgi:hypothetical protein
MDCLKCKYYDTEDNFCKALECDIMNCEEPLPCEIDEESCKRDED